MKFCDVFKKDLHQEVNLKEEFDNNPNRLAGRRLWDSERVLPDYYYFFFRKRKELMIG